MSSPSTSNEPVRYGLVAEFNRAEDLLRATQKAFDDGYRSMDAYSPFPIHGLSEALGQRFTRLPWIVFVGGLLGAIGGFALQYWTSAIDYPLIIGGRPFNSWPAFIPVTFECTVLAAGVTTVISLFALNRLPMPYHPIFNTPGFERASVDRFFLCIKGNDPRFEESKTQSWLRSLGAERVVAIDV